MSWCRIIEANGEQYLCTLVPGSEGLALVTSWMVGDRVMSAILPPSDFDGPGDIRQFLADLRPENVLMLRKHTEQAMQQRAEAESHVIAAEAIARAKGLH